MKKGLFIFLLSITIFYCFGQSEKYEFRAVWVATVANIDWPSSPRLSVEQQKKEVLEILELHKKIGNNAIILQVRPASDALYKSELEPWSRYLTGKQGVAPSPYYDPLEFWISETHKRGMELHAWFNPYRIKQNLIDTLTEDHIISKHPDWGWIYGDRLYFEPGNPDVWEFVTDVVVDVVKRYDIDAIHFDDYFYPYKIANQEIPDSSAFRKYGSVYYPDKVDDWRRHNVDTIIRKLNIAIKETKPWVKFGISPFGVWRNRTNDPTGSETRAGTTNFDGLYADIIKWQKEGWIDYSMPQLYWRDDHPAADFSTLAYWWNDFSYGRAMYYGLAPYRINKKSNHKLWRNEKSLLDQITLTRSLTNVQGFGYFSSVQFFRKELSKLNKKLIKQYCNYPAIVPPMPWIDNVAPLAPGNLEIDGNKLSWNSPESECEMDKARFYVIYKYELKQKRYLKDASNIIGITGETEFLLQGKNFEGVYRITSLDRLNNESQLSELLMVD